MEMEQGFTIWLTGLSGSGKSTLAEALRKRFLDLNAKVEVLDGDVVRTNVSLGLGFSKTDRDENIRRIGFICELLSRNGVVAIVAAVSPYREARYAVRSEIANFIEVHMDCPLEALIARDVKGLYRKALSGEIPQFTGISDPYEPPLQPEVRIDSSVETLQRGLEKVWDSLLERKLVPSAEVQPVGLAAAGYY